MCNIKSTIQQKRLTKIKQHVQTYHIMFYLHWYLHEKCQFDLVKLLNHFILLHITVVQYVHEAQ